MEMTNIEVADAIIKAYERWARDVAMQSHCYSVEGQYSESEEEERVKASQPELCEEALIDCRHAIAALSVVMRENLISQYMGLQGYYRKKLNPKQRCRARGVRNFDNVTWQRDVELALVSFLNLLRKQSGPSFNRYFIQQLNLH